MLTAFLWRQKARQIRCAYYISIATSVQTERLPKICLPLEPPAIWKKIETGKLKAQTSAVVEEVDFLCDLLLPMRRKELT